MNRFWHTEDSLVNKISYYHILLLVICLPLDRFYGEVVFVSFCIHTAINFRKSQLSVFKHFKPLFAVQALFWVTAISLLYSPMPRHGFEADLGEQMPMLLIPVLFALHHPLIVKYQQRFLDAFSMSCLMVVIWLFGIVLLSVHYFHLPLSAIISPSFTNHNFSKPVKIHATFLSVMLVPAAINLLQKLQSESRLWMRVVIVAAVLVFFAAIVQLSSKTVVFSLIVLFALYVVVKPFTRRKAWLITGISALLLLLSFVVIRSSTLQGHLVVDLKRDLDMKAPQDITDSRLDRWKLIAGVIKQKPLFGNGAGTEQDVLQNLYFTHKFYNSYLNHLNAHNQYLSLWMQSGLWGLIIYLLVLAYGFRIALQSADWIMLSFILAIAISSIGEDMLLYNKNIFLFSILYSMFLITKKIAVFHGNNTPETASEATLTQFSTC